jgi:EVE domain-containing protein
MPNLFVFTAGNPEARAHLSQSIESPIPASMVLDSFEESLRPALLEIQEKAQGFYAWGAVPGSQNEGRWKRMAVGDSVLCVYDNTYRYSGKVLAKFQNRKFAEAVWGRDGEGQTWEYMYFLTKPLQIECKVSDLAEDLSQRYLGFTKISDDRVDRLERTYGSLDAFVEARLQSIGAPAYLLLRSNLESKWKDEEASSYHYGTTVPNYTKIVPGAEFLLDRRTPTGTQIVAHGTIGVVSEEKEADRGTAFRASFTAYRRLKPPRLITDEVRAKLAGLPNYNVQHSIRVLSRDLFAQLALPARAWIFQANPKSYDVLKAVRTLPEDDWTVTDYTAEIGPGDRVYVWMAGSDGGIVAVADVLDRPSKRGLRPEARGFVHDPRFQEEQLRVRLAIRRALDPILSRREIQVHAALRELSILKFSNATNFRVRREEAEVIETMIDRHAESLDLRSPASLRKLYERFLQTRPYNPYKKWAEELRSFLQWVSETPRGQRATQEFQERLWDSNAVSSVGRGDIPVDRAIADEGFRAWLTDASLRPVPSDRGQARTFLEQLHVELLERIKLFTSKMPYLKVLRTLTALFPRHFTTVADRRKLEELHEAMFEEVPESSVAQHGNILDRLEEVLGPLPSDFAGLTDRIIFPWYLYETAVAKAPEVSKRDEPGKGNTPTASTDIQSIRRSLREAKLYFSDEVLANYLLALQTKRFVILTGISGTGKTQLAIAIAKHFRPLVTTTQIAETPEGSTPLEVQPYMLRHKSMQLPVAIRSQLHLPPPDPGTRGGGTIQVTYPGGRTTLALWRDPERRYGSTLWFKGAFWEWFRMLPVGTILALEVEEPADDTAYTGLAFSVPTKEFSVARAENYCVIAVRPDWTDHRGLLGYYNPLTNQYVAPGLLRLLLRAQSEVDRAKREGRAPEPYFVVLDEMNLARVEQYFSDFLSCLESDEEIELHEEEKVEEGDTDDAFRVPRRLRIPANIFFTGTVNVDETTHMFSPKVLDRAFTIELHDVDLRRFGQNEDTDSEATAELRLERLPPSLVPGGNPDVDDWHAFGQLRGGELQDAVSELNALLGEHSRQFGYRVAVEIARFVTLASQQTSGDAPALWSALDLALFEKVLPKFHGTQEELEPPLLAIFAFAVSGSRGPGEESERWDQWLLKDGQLKPTADTDSAPRFPRLARKVWMMLRRLREQGFTAFIE